MKLVKESFHCSKCDGTFDEIGGKQYRDGDVDLWCPLCGASDDFIDELSTDKITTELVVRRLGLYFAWGV